MLSKFFGAESHFEEWKLSQSWKSVPQFSIFISEISLFRVKFTLKILESNLICAF